MLPASPADHFQCITLSPSSYDPLASTSPSVLLNIREQKAADVEIASGITFLLLLLGQWQLLLKQGSCSLSPVPPGSFLLQNEADSYSSKSSPFYCIAVIMSQITKVSLAHQNHSGCSTVSSSHRSVRVV